MRYVRRVGGRRAQAAASPRPPNPSNTSEARTVGYTYTIKRLARCASFKARSLSPRTKPYWYDSQHQMAVRGEEGETSEEQGTASQAERPPQLSKTTQHQFLAYADFLSQKGLARLLPALHQCVAESLHKYALAPCRSLRGGCEGPTGWSSRRTHTHLYAWPSLSRREVFSREPHPLQRGCSTPLHSSAQLHSTPHLSSTPLLTSAPLHSSAQLHSTPHLSSTPLLSSAPLHSSAQLHLLSRGEVLSCSEAAPLTDRLGARGCAA
jgi:hypothetical protein